MAEELAEEPDLEAEPVLDAELGPGVELAFEFAELDGSFWVF